MAPASDIERPADSYEHSAFLSSAATLTACFGVACLFHDRCARYAAVDLSEPDSGTMGTCRQGNSFPSFVALPAQKAVLESAFGVPNNSKPMCRESA